MNEIDCDAGEIRSFTLQVLGRLGIDNWHMGISITDDCGIREYNRRWRGIDAATDVLSFVQGEGHPVPSPPGVPYEAGDIVVSAERVRRNAEELAGDFETELRRVIIHGILHLKGMEHPGDDYEGEMLKLQEELVAGTRDLTVGG